MNTLYSLAFLLTADHRTAEQCFLVAFDDCLHGADVFPGWARSWSRRAIVKQAIRLVNPRPETVGVTPEAPRGKSVDVPRLLLELPSFDRFVFAMTVLEKYSARECAALLNCVPSDVEKAKSRALQSIGVADSNFIPRGPAAGSLPAVNIGLSA